uniref:NADH-ubiquinone oxidoreductase chain 2 n=1 Tax=Alitta succinea TaxID=981110 RepID=A0A7G8JTK3_ALISU|nr:NADH dehydrogenase subunit 2 [Alitta succinea]
MTPSSLLFLSTMAMGTIVTLSSSNWLYLWMGMELNLLSFVPLIATTSSLQETEASVKYFIIQAIGSSLMLTAGIMASNPNIFSSKKIIISVMFISSMILKLGMAPCHQWLPHVMSSIPWMMCLTLATWQKISPMVMLMMLSTTDSHHIMMLMAMLSAMIGGIGGLNQSQMRTLLAYSSIGHMGWLVSTVTCSYNTFMTYFITYITITCAAMYLFMQSNIIHSKLFMKTKTPPMTFTIIMLTLFSLGGLPPLLGFFPKWMIINSMMSQSMMMITSMLVLGSLMNLFYYFNMSFNYIITPANSPTPNKTKISSIAISTLATITPMFLML